MEARVHDQTFAWSLLEAAVPSRTGAQVPSLTSGLGKETEVGGALSPNSHVLCASPALHTIANALGCCLSTQDRQLPC